eukprot:CAMPEP_0117648528 /NCGR_PEP_ID=MMETSP0804-20121206/455_1 /TAXON_ID=1074897 /ORGANISM="Tetraselmis astigmatica, Strain CCMP880" /LENGTH=136 /DNA_ID=CAMNT_0005454141 /DNA_START=242 /DNA_END=652 /DNA_ORIENTATION=-
MSATEAGDGSPAASDSVVVQYVVLRRDLWGEMGWPLGSVVAQACHASTAVLWQSREDNIVQSYCAPENIDSMHKVVLQIKGETQLRNLSTKLEEAGIVHKLWIEQPEDFPTCLATKPYPKSEVSSFFKKLQLCKGT